MSTHRKADKAKRKARYDRQKGRTEDNRKRKRERHMKRHPNDKTLVGKV